MKTEAKRMHWMHLNEVGASWGLRFTEWVYRLMGFRFASWVVQGVVSYFFIFKGNLRKASSEYLKNLKAYSPESLSFDKTPSWKEVFSHFREFGITTLERFDIWLGRYQSYRFHHQGQEALLDLAKRKQGALFLGAHLGSFDVLRALSLDYDIKVNVLWFRKNSSKIVSLLERLAPNVKLNIVDYEPGQIDAVFALRDAIARGEFIAVMGDRISARTDSGREKFVQVPFLGKPAHFPQGPWILASVLECPVFFTAGIRSGLKTYHLQASPLSQQVQLPRVGREEAIKKHVSQYVTEIESLCKKFPYQWFNFYDFWSDDDQTK